MISRATLKPAATVLAIGLALFQIYFTAGFGVMDSQMLRVIHLGTVLTLVFIYLPPRKMKEGQTENPLWLLLDLVLICGASGRPGFWCPISITTWNASDISTL